MTAQSATAIQPKKEKETVLVRQGPGELLEQFDRIYDSIARRAFELFENNGRWIGNDLADWFRAEAEFLHPLHLEVKETGDAYTVRAEVPGFAADELDIRVEPRCLRISGKRETKEEKKKATMIRSEWCSDRILRAVDLPAEIDAAKASATLKDGILTIDLPKAAPAKSVRIQAKSS
jgi:HSP20 family protein